MPLSYALRGINLQWPRLHNYPIIYREGQLPTAVLFAGLYLQDFVGGDGESLEGIDFFDLRVAFYSADRVVVNVDRTYLNFLMGGFFGNGLIDDEEANVIEVVTQVRTVVERQAVIQYIILHKNAFQLHGHLAPVVANATDSAGFAQYAVAGQG